MKFRKMPFYKFIATILLIIPAGLYIYAGWVVEKSLRDTITCMLLGMFLQMFLFAVRGDITWKTLNPFRKRGN